jgi:hypothetical protein
MASSPDMMWGIKSETRGTNAAQGFALIAGLAYVAFGLIGWFFTGFDNFTENTNEALFGIFAINPYANFVLMAIGAAWLLSALVLTGPAAEGANFAIGGFLVVAAVLGFLGYFTALLSVDNPMDPVNFLHLIAGVLSVLFSGLFGNR